MRLPFLAAIALSVSAGCSRAQAPIAAAPAPSPPATVPAMAAPAVNTPTLTSFPVHENDVWVMVGDSITEQKLYTAYMEAFVRARYPKLKFAAVHSGKSGEVYGQGVLRFKRTVAAFKPTLITVNFGMNDHTKVLPLRFNFQDDPANAPQRFIDAAKAVNARLIMMSASPLLTPASAEEKLFKLTAENGAQWPSGLRTNAANKIFADKVAIVAAHNGVPFLDQLTPLRTIWSENYPRDTVARMRDGVRVFLADPPQPGASPFAGTSMFLYQSVKPIVTDKELLATLPVPDKDNFVAKWLEKRKPEEREKIEAYHRYLTKWAAEVDVSVPPFVRLSGFTKSARSSDLIHPNEAGHLHMAAVLLKHMKADGLVSEVTINAATGKLAASKKAAVTDISFKDGGLTFKRLDESLPFPVDPLARPALGIDTATPLGSPKDLFGLSRYLTAVTGLPAGKYDIQIDGQTVATASAAELARGVDLGLADKGPVFAQTQKLWAAVQANLVDALATMTAEQMAAVTPKILPEAQPVEHTWTLRPAKG